jgi:ADP-ribosylglycohydrolase
MRTSARILILLALAALPVSKVAAEPKRLLRLDADRLENKIRGGLLGQLLGNLNGLPHEFKYIDEPGQVDEYTPSLPEGARTDDDTDIEWVYLREIARSRQVLLPPKRIAQLWKTRINRRIWCANLYARQLMDLGLEPPWTGNPALNPWSEFNISGQFVCESFGLMAPAMPQTAARIGLNYTRVTIDGEPAQTTQLFTAMIATAFVENDLDRILDAGLASVDPNSQIARIVTEVRQICRNYPEDWQAARREFKTRWQTHGGAIRDRNGYELNTACTIAALIYGRGNFVETLRIAFNLGWDCDNNAATAGTIVGVIRGRRWMDEQGWNIADRYANTTRDNMPMDETITGLENTLIACARLVIEGQGGELIDNDGVREYRMPDNYVRNVRPLFTASDAEAQARQYWLPRLRADLEKPGVPRARAAYLAICLGEADRLRRESPAAWPAAIAELQKHDVLIKEIFRAAAPAAQRLVQSAKSAGLTLPPR